MYKIRSIFCVVFLISFQSMGMQGEQVRRDDSWSLGKELRHECFEGGRVIEVDLRLLTFPFYTILPANTDLLLANSPIYARVFAHGFLTGMNFIKGTGKLLSAIQQDYLSERYFKLGIRLAGHVIALAATVGIGYKLLPTNVQSEIIPAVLLIKAYNLIIEDNAGLQDQFVALSAGALLAYNISGIKAVDVLQKNEIKVLLSLLIAFYSFYRIAKLSEVRPSSRP